MSGFSWDFQETHLFLGVSGKGAGTCTCTTNVKKNTDIYIEFGCAARNMGVNLYFS